MALSSAQIYALNMLTYAGFNKESQSAIGPNTAQSLMEHAATTGMTVGEYVESLQDAYGGQASVYDETFQQILSDPTLSSMTIANYDRMSESNANMIVFTSESASEAVIAYEGSQSGADWRDNFDGVGNTNQPDGVSTAFQQKALDYVNSAEVQAIISQYATVTTTGHSKGGNNAAYVNILSSDVDRSITFDAPGFSDEFFNTYRDEIARSQDSIDNYSAHDDYVNILQNAIGTQHYIQKSIPDNYEDCVDTSLSANGFAVAHDPAAIQSFFYEGGTEVEQLSIMSVLDRCLNSYLRQASDLEKKIITTFLGDLSSRLLYKTSDMAWYETVFISLAAIYPIATFVEYIFDCLLKESLWELFSQLFPDLAESISSFLNKPLVVAALNNHSHIAFPDGSDLTVESVHVADRIVLDTGTLQAICTKLKTLSSELDSCRAAVLSCTEVCADINFVMTLTMTLHFVLSSWGKLMGTPEHILRDTATSLHECSTEVQALSTRLSKLISQIENTEHNLVSRASALSVHSEAPFLTS